jgi:hypothetical protein
MIISLPLYLGTFDANYIIFKIIEKLFFKEQIFLKKNLKNLKYSWIFYFQHEIFKIK